MPKNAVNPKKVQKRPNKNYDFEFKFGNVWTKFLTRKDTLLGL